ncbi:MAG: YodC family protein [Planktomarina sp.]
MKIEPGSTVTLKSGGPTMTVTELGEHDDARCFWFYGNELGREWFSLVALRLAPPVPQSAVASQPRPAAGQAQQPQQRPNGQARPAGAPHPGGA